MIRNTFTVVRNVALLCVAMISLSVSAQSTSYRFSELHQSQVTGLLDNNTPERSYWGLSEAEWQRYETIRAKTPFAVWQHQATPLALLAFYSDSEADKRRYAARQAQLDQWRESLNYDWQNLYNEEREKVWQANVKQVQGDAEHKTLDTLTANDQTLVFIDLTQCERTCLAQSRQVIHSGAKSHLYFVGRTSPTAIRQWAQQLQVPPEKTHRGVITLNQEQGEAAQYGVNVIELANSAGIKVFYHHPNGVKALL